MSRRCRECQREVDPALMVCPHCGRLVAEAVPGATGGRRRLLLLAALGATLALALFTLARPKPNRNDCRGGEHPTIEWKAPPGTVRDENGHLTGIDPAVTPHVRIAVVRHTGNAAYARNCEHEYGHNHQPVVDLGHQLGANAYFHDRPRPLGAGEFEVTTTLVVAHPGPIPRALRDRSFSSGRAMQVVRVVPGGVAEGAGLAVNDLVIALNGQPAAVESGGFLHQLDAIPAGGRLQLDVIRAGEPRHLTLVRDGREKFGIVAIDAPVLEVGP